MSMFLLHHIYMHRSHDMCSNIYAYLISLSLCMHLRVALSVSHSLSLSLLLSLSLSLSLSLCVSLPKHSPSVPLSSISLQGRFSINGMQVFFSGRLKLKSLKGIGKLTKTHKQKQKHSKTSRQQKQKSADLLRLLGAI